MFYLLQNIVLEIYFNIKYNKDIFLKENFGEVFFLLWSVIKKSIIRKLGERIRVLQRQEQKSQKTKRFYL